MPGGRQRRLHSLSATPPAREDEEPLAETSTRRTRTGRPRGRPRMRPTPRAPSPEEDQVAASGYEGDQGAPAGDEDDQAATAGGFAMSGHEEAATAGGFAMSGHKEAATVGGSSSSGGSTVYLHGPSTLPRRPIPVHQRPMIRPVGDGYVTIHVFSTCSYDMLTIKMETNNSS